MKKTPDAAKHDCVAYFIDDSFRREALVLCSFCRNIDWSENGLGIASWRYRKKRKCHADSIKKAFIKMNTIKLSSRSSMNRTAGIGDIICVDDNPWIITGGGFERVPLILWDRIDKK